MPRKSLGSVVYEMLLATICAFASIWLILLLSGISFAVQGH